LILSKLKKKSIKKECSIKKGKEEEKKMEKKGKKLSFVYRIPRIVNR